VLVPGRPVIEADDERQVLHGIAIAIDIDDVADVRPELAAERVDGWIGRHDQDGA